jgi:hypothetical protein
MIAGLSPHPREMIAIGPGSRSDSDDHPASGFTRLQCPDCGHERLLAFTCKGRHFCPFRHRFLHALREAKLISPKKLADLLSWKHSGFHIHDGGEKPVAAHDSAGRKRLAEYLLRHPFSLQKITWNETTKTVIYRSKRHHNTKRNFEIFKAPDFIAAALLHLPPKGQQTVRYYGTYSNKTRGQHPLIPDRIIRPPASSNQKSKINNHQSEIQNLQSQILLIPAPPKQSARDMRPLWRDLILQTWGGDPRSHYVVGAERLTAQELKVTDFPELAWVERKHFVGVRIYKGRKVFVFEEQFDRKRMTPTEARMYFFAKQVDPKTTPEKVFQPRASKVVAYLDVTTQLPVLCNDGRKLYHYSFKSQDAGRLRPPQAIIDFLRKRQAMLQARITPPAGPGGDHPGPE